MKTEEIVSNLFDDFRRYAGKEITSTKKQHTIKLVNRFITSMMNIVLQDKSFCMVEQYTFLVKNDFPIDLDRAIIKAGGEVVVHCEDKAYGDIDMLKRFIADSAWVVSRCPEVKI